MISNKRYWYTEWKKAEKEGDTNWAVVCKNKFISLVTTYFKRTYNMYGILKQYPTIYLN